MDQIRILSLDGGGGLAGILAVALGRLYGAQTPGREIVRQFDFAVGTSGGSIVLTALCCNYTPHEIASFYADPDTVRRMFSPRWSAVFKRILPLRLLFPPYSATGKFKALKDLFDRNGQGGEPLPSQIPLIDWPKWLGCPINLLVTAYDYDRERATFFRSNNQSLAQSSAPHINATLAEAVHASTNAPIFFYGEPAEFRGGRYWDGGLAGYGNPVLAGVVEAMANFPGRTDDMRVLSIGTGIVRQASTTDGAQPPLGVPPASTCVARGAEEGGHGDRRRSAGGREFPRVRRARPADADTGPDAARQPHGPPLPVRAADLEPFDGRMGTAERADEQGIRRPRRTANGRDDPRRAGADRENGQSLGRRRDHEPTHPHRSPHAMRHRRRHVQRGRRALVANRAEEADRDSPSRPVYSLPPNGPWLLGSVPRVR